MIQKIKHLDLTLYSKKLKNGLSIYVLPKNNINNIYATYTTHYGSVDTKFRQNGEVISSPDGIAHFLEHKMFEQKNGIDPFKIFDENGASANANTSSYRTSYLFSGPTKFKQNLKTLLSFVNEPYFTDENVEKEKGIIIQEIKMGEDEIGRVGYNKTMYNAFVKHPIRIKTIGSIESVNSITKEELYKCYNAFYNPDNMYLIVTGNIDPNEVFEIAEKTLKKYKFKKFETEKILYDEPDKVHKKKEIIYTNVTIPKLFYSYKINMENIKLDRETIIKYLSIYLNSLFGSVSDFDEEIKKEKICDDGIDYMISKTDKHLLITFMAETKKTSKLINKIKKTIGNEISLDEFNRKKKVYLSSYIFMSDNIYQMNNKILNDLLDKNEVDIDMYENIKNLRYDVLLNLINQIKFDKTVEVILKSNKKK